ncbi:MAG TPA: response regulator transcription factor [Acetobacteraceae bacterium]|jgi:DNA-binding NarL/FixJ family response regulator|nr:response regulator transcription factor [Verrucomicrobiae bacterium]HUB45659.1 response regulator transcription factor [Acetobacteraceae bacterium]
MRNPADRTQDRVEPFASNEGFRNSTVIRVALIDCLRFTRDCLIRAFRSLHPDLLMMPFLSAAECIQTSPDEFDIILFYSHENTAADAGALQKVKALRAAFPDLPVLILSDARGALQPRTIRNTLASGIQGFIPTQTAEATTVVAAIRFVRDGGTFVPPELLLAGQTDEADEDSASSPVARLTPRQLIVLSLLRQGKANKTIAHELGMTESTVKVHIRNIMRKMGATNRTQAVYMAELLGNPSGDPENGR